MNAIPLNLDPAAYRDRRVMVTGADGFIGSHLAEALLKLGARVIPFLRGSARLGSGTWNFRCLETPPERFESILCGDIASPDTIHRIADAAPDILFHLAAIAYVDYSFRCPVEVFQVNAGGALNVLEAARRIPGIERVIVTSSSEVYGACQTESIDESHPLNPTSPYAASKVAADRLAFSYRATFGLPVVVLRPFNAYGPRHTYDVIPKFIRLALGGDPLTVHGDGLQSRDFNYVDDTVAGFLLAGAKPEGAGEVFNLGSGEDVSVRRIAEMIVRLTDSRSPIIHGPERAAEVLQLRADAARARRVLGYAPRVTLEEGLRRNIEWERRRMDGGRGAH